MATMLVTYRTPANVEEFERHYFDVHVPIAKQLPGLLEYRVSRGPVTSPSSGDVPFLVVMLRFASVEEIRAAFGSEIGRQCAQDRRFLAPDDGASNLIIFDDREV